jgi:hypothetical protein
MTHIPEAGCAAPHARAAAALSPTRSQRPSKKNSRKDREKFDEKLIIWD